MDDSSLSNCDVRVQTGRDTDDSIRDAGCGGAFATATRQDRVKSRSSLRHVEPQGNVFERP
jgi:hypothetical protein